MTGDHYFSPQPGAADVRSDIEFTVAGRDYALTVAAGVFSASRLDPGTAVLLRKADLPTAADPGPLLDLGCGYGPITCVLAEHAPTATVYAVDVNARARELTMVNAHRLGVADRVQVADPDTVPPELRFRQLWSNPPIRIGKPELRALLSRWLPRLAPDGVGWLVIARYLGGDSVQQWLREQGWQVDRHASQKGYRVLRVTHPTG
ncbi:class I SAM-dependent methyltransferase [Micromonospora sp. NBC_01813]|uniref:class I SAM-dependent methyltransferase n=1 Tax=Micromonospora sp. NBC_01813 TaxID=2975988 RepID=UPI002DD8D415|nr:methyltransferase [Micromonospora sp. NBC_01813]WSA08216.1 class I SAM-dependent methyltransferase [Micromonospora sp. NBC_01813]